MFGGWTFAKKLIVGYGLAALILAIMAVIAYRTTAGFVESDQQVTASFDKRSELRKLLSELLDAETGQRGYLLTGDVAYLAPYQSALGQISTSVSTLQNLAGNNAGQQRQLAAMQPLITTKLAELKRTIELRRDTGFDAALKEVTTNEGKTAMDQIRAIIEDFDQQESDHIKTLVSDGKAGAQLTLAVLIWGSLLGVIVVAAIGWVITRSLTRQIGNAVLHVQSSSSELQVAANQQATGLREQATAMSEITTTITELLVTSRQIAESAQRVAQIADQTASGATSGQGAVNVAQDAIAGIRRQVDQIVEYMLDLGKKSQQIGAVLDIVAELAEQTNILAINATIEAAGAGDSGLRFAVVADEIRKLADRVSGSTKEIRALIDDVRSAVNTTVMATETGSKAVDTGSQQFSDVASGFRHIADLVTTTSDAAREIELSTKQQSTAVEQVNLAIANVAQASHETEASAGQTLQTASELAHLSADLARIIRPQAVAA